MPSIADPLVARRIVRHIGTRYEPLPLAPERARGVRTVNARWGSSALRGAEIQVMQASPAPQVRAWALVEVPRPLPDPRSLP